MNQKFAEKLQSLRKEKGLTQAELAEKVSVSPQAVSKWEKGESLPDISTLMLLADFFDVTVDELLGKEVKKTPIVEVVEPPKGDYSSYFLRVVAESSDGDRARVNLPLSIVKIMFSAKSEIKIGNINLTETDFAKIIEMVEAGAVGELITAESKDGDFAKIYVEKINENKD